jgi:hypothetical protein
VLLLRDSTSPLSSYRTMKRPVLSFGSNTNEVFVSVELFLCQLSAIGVNFRITIFNVELYIVSSTRVSFTPPTLPQR